jgi:hypothetical protein
VLLGDLLLCWAYAGSAIPLNVAGLLQSTMNLSIPLVLGALVLHVRAVGRDQHRDRGQLLVARYRAAVPQARSASCGSA